MAGGQNLSFKHLLKDKINSAKNAQLEKFIYEHAKQIQEEVPIQEIYSSSKPIPRAANLMLQQLLGMRGLCRPGREVTTFVFTLLVWLTLCTSCLGSVDINVDTTQDKEITVLTPISSENYYSYIESYDLSQFTELDQEIKQLQYEIFGMMNYSTDNSFCSEFSDERYSDEYHIIKPISNL